MEIPVSIFNDVLGPIMRGPSSSHTAASVRIGKIAAQLLDEKIKRVLVEFTPDGSLATTYDGQGSDIGLAAGLMGLDLSSSKIVNSLSLIKSKGIELKFAIRNFPNNHPNTYKLTLLSVNDKKLEVIAISTGGGMIKITHINGFEVDIQGGYFELILFVKESNKKNLILAEKQIKEKYKNAGIELININTIKDVTIINIKTSKSLSNKTREEIGSTFLSTELYYTPPVLPIHSRNSCKVPFTTSNELIKSMPRKKVQLWEMAIMYEAQRGNISEEEVLKNASTVYKAMNNAIKTGLKGTKYNDRILGRQSHLISKAVRTGRILDTPLINNVIQNTMAVMESKSAFQVIVAAPTAGSCAVIPGAIIGCADTYGFSEDECIKAILSAGLIGVLIASQSTFSADVAGCQAECGAASAMAAAGIVQLLGGNAQEAVNAASFALQNLLGLICDPVANRVEVPCLGKNILGAINGITSANITMASINTVIPLDEVIGAMTSVGHSLPSELRCTGCGGLSITDTAKKLERKLGSYRKQNTPAIG